MIVNKEHDNTIEGNYLVIKALSDDPKVVFLDLPADLFVNGSNCSDWMLGWGNNAPLFDAGVENLVAIEDIDIKNGRLATGKLLRGVGMPAVGQRVVLWNRNPSGYKPLHERPVVCPDMWPEFKGESFAFGGIAFDDQSGQWVMFVSEYDTVGIQIYAAISNDFIIWTAANNGKPVFRPSDFKNCSWAGYNKDGTVSQTPLISDITHLHNKWYLFMSGFDSIGRQQVGIAVSDESLLGPYKVFPEPVLSNGVIGSWNEGGVFCAHVHPFQNKFIMFFDGINSDGYEQVGMATSFDLLKWDIHAGNPVIDDHEGWRSSVGSSEPCLLEVKHDSIFLLVAGSKEFKMGPWHHYISGRMYMDKSGNVDDIQLGLFLSVDGGKTFIAHQHNPVLTNDYANSFENEHMGVGIAKIETDSATFLFYQAKSDFEGLKYNIMSRIRYE